MRALRTETEANRITNDTANSSDKKKVEMNERSGEKVAACHESRQKNGKFITEIRDTWHNWRTIWDFDGFLVIWLDMESGDECDRMIQFAVRAEYLRQRQFAASLSSTVSFELFGESTLVDSCGQVDVFVRKLSDFIW